MRAALPLALLLLAPLAMPVALAEEWVPRAAGGTFGSRSGVTGLQFGEHSGVGLRYWNNGTAEDAPVLLLTTCYASGSGSIVVCEQHRLAP